MTEHLVGLEMRFAFARYPLNLGVQLADIDDFARVLLHHISRLLYSENIVIISAGFDDRHCRRSEIMLY